VSILLKKALHDSDSELIRKVIKLGHSFVVVK
jgi:hypothetical protein